MYPRVSSYTMYTHGCAHWEPCRVITVCIVTLSYCLLMTLSVTGKCCMQLGNSIITLAREPGQFCCININDSVSLHRSVLQRVLLSTLLGDLGWSIFWLFLSNSSMMLRKRNNFLKELFQFDFCSSAFLTAVWTRLQEADICCTSILFRDSSDLWQH